MKRRSKTLATKTGPLQAKLVMTNIRETPEQPQCGK